MVLGALGGALVMRYFGDSVSGAQRSCCSVLLGSVAVRRRVFDCCSASPRINFKADQTLVGTAMNLLGTAGATVIGQGHQHRGQPRRRLLRHPVCRRRRRPSSSTSANSSSTGSCSSPSIAIVFAWVTLYKTRFGLRLMACGEHPQAADSVGINVYKMRWAGVLISGMLGGLGGICYILAGVSELAV